LLAFVFLVATPLVAQSELENELLGYVNADRERESLKTLKWNETIYKVAIAHSKDMAQMERVSHTGSDGSLPLQRIRESGVFASKLAENVARDLNIVAVHTSLMESLYHRQNILNPEYTEIGIGVVVKEKYLYVTEVFIRSVDDYSLDDARRILITRMNEIRVKRALGPLSLTSTLNNMAQSHVEFQERVSSLGPPLIMNLMARQARGSLRASVYTTTSLSFFPDEVKENLQLNLQTAGIGFKRIKGDLCNTGCFLITLIFGPEIS
jgi:uncharacterized protein YkwD